MIRPLRVNDFTNPEEGFPRSARFFGGGSTVVPDNSEAMMRMMREQDARNAELSAAHQERMIAMQERQAEMERGNVLALQRQEEELKLAQQRMEDEAQGEALAQAVESDQDYDQIITGFYGALGGERPE
tara:strand:- start:713 stop:1099 length:387 start_codon:yes stop_codon:yes gene_type:complete